ncbi:carbohydrate kinase family protein [Candidatus Woesearchaeota archaeon]|jgi:sugar/nucleoside kinase (ribokinase family)|nr:carbohydrate kinase family protein [Candidatus Woesearchaeota archaeon]MBT4387851.1 carbohydrate kinase family protein [Candidatus Woesearchaeota archaeon]MBT4595670.1 carbohydrate kinase family protein [Candidatus Woesearchaeota archaeon]MBT5740847.1 carbohydrate kinase family protein [Candidatus Woesearchaeota archaeon]MBT6505995.1 carbohydrate kinase family protein [Candidatus Woesearchaeota archaeon]
MDELRSFLSRPIKSDELDLLVLGEAMVDVYHEPISTAEFKQLGIDSGGWYLFDPNCENSLKLCEKIRKIPITKKIPGGCPSNVAVNIRQLGASAGMITALGGDNNGNLFFDHLEDNNIEKFAQYFNSKTNPFLHVLFDETGERTFFAYTGATPQINLDFPVPKSKILFTSGYEVGKIGLPVVDFASKFDGIVAFDVASAELAKDNLDLFRKMLNYTDILFTSKLEETYLFGDRPDVNYELSCHVKKHGDKGAIISYNEGVFSINADPILTAQAGVSCEDGYFQNTNGAGDGFAAGFLYGLLNGFTYEDSGSLASKLASTVIMYEEPFMKKRSLRVDVHKYDLEQKYKKELEKAS